MQMFINSTILTINYKEATHTHPKYLANLVSNDSEWHGTSKKYKIKSMSDVFVKTPTSNLKY